jgi:isoleucyl-tRNA synthetase
LDISDRIVVTWESDAEATVAALTSHADLVASEVLATTWSQGTVAEPTATDEELGLKVLITKA